MASFHIPTHGYTYLWDMHIHRSNMNIGLVACKSWQNPLKPSLHIPTMMFHLWHKPLKDQCMCWGHLKKSVVLHQVYISLGILCHDFIWQTFLVASTPLLSASFTTFPQLLITKCSLPHAQAPITTQPHVMTHAQPHAVASLIHSLRLWTPVHSTCGFLCSQPLAMNPFLLHCLAHQHIPYHSSFVSTQPSLPVYNTLEGALQCSSHNLSSLFSSHPLILLWNPWAHWPVPRNPDNHRDCLISAISIVLVLLDILIVLFKIKD